MKRLAGIVMVCTLLALSGFGLANNGRSAGHGCSSSLFGPTSNFGHLVRVVRAATGLNPHEASAFFGYRVNEVIEIYCTN